MQYGLSGVQVMHKNGITSSLWLDKRIVIKIHSIVLQSHGINKAVPYCSERAREAAS